MPTSQPHLYKQNNKQLIKQQQKEFSQSNPKFLGKLYLRECAPQNTKKGFAYPAKTFS